MQQKGEIAKERRSKNVLDIGATFRERSSDASSDYKIDSSTSIFPVCFYVIHNMSIIINVIQDENSGSNDEEGKLLDCIA